MTGIASVAVALPEGELANAELARRHPSWSMERVVRRAGVRTRRVVSAGETAFDLSLRACEALVEREGIDLGGIDAVLYCTQSPDYRMPGNAHLLHRELGLGDGVLAFDYSLACSGYVYGLAIADSFVRSGLASSLLLVTAETMTNLINPGDRAVATLFGDGAAVTHLSVDPPSGGRIVARRLCSDGSALDRVYVPAGAAREPSSGGTRRECPGDGPDSVRTREDMRMDGPAVWAFINSKIPAHVESFLREQGLTIEDVDLCVFHQASRLVLDSLMKALSIGEEKMFVHMEETGNLSSVSIPVALHAALEQGAIQPGDRVLMTAYGAGMSYGSVLVEY